MPLYGFFFVIWGVMTLFMKYYYIPTSSPEFSDDYSWNIIDFFGYNNSNNNEFTLNYSQIKYAISSSLKYRYRYTISNSTEAYLIFLSSFHILLSTNLKQVYSEVRSESIIIVIIICEYMWNFHKANFHLTKCSIQQNIFEIQNKLELNVLNYI